MCPDLLADTSRRAIDMKADWCTGMCMDHTDGPFLTPLHTGGPLADVWRANIPGTQGCGVMGLPMHTRTHKRMNGRAGEVGEADRITLSG